MRPRRRKLTAAKFINVDRGVSAEEYRERLQERDARLAADTRSELQKLLGEPEACRSALAAVPIKTKRRLPSNPPVWKIVGGLRQRR